MLVHGGPGSGKTELAAHVRAWAMEHDLTVLSGRGWADGGSLGNSGGKGRDFFSKIRKFSRKMVISSGSK